MANLRNPFTVERKTNCLFWVVLASLYVLYSLYTSQMYHAYMIQNGLTEYDFMQCFRAYALFFKAESLNNFSVVEIGKIFCFKWMFHLIVVLVAYYLMISARGNGFRGIEGGSADVATSAQKKAYCDPSGIPIANNLYVALQNHEYSAKKKVSAKSTYVQRTTSNLNQLIVGSSGCGKTFRALTPQLLQGKLLGNFVVTDPKGELYRNTAKFFKEENYDIKVLNLHEPKYSNHYNPFSYIRDEDDLLSLVELFMKSSAGEGQKTDFWTGSAQSLLTGIMLYIINMEQESDRRDFRRVLELISGISYIDGFISPDCEYVQCMLAYRTAHPDTVDAVTLSFNSARSTPEQTFGGVVATLLERLRLWLSKSIDVLTREDEMGFDDFGEGDRYKIIYVIVPPASTTYAGVVTMFYSQLYNRLLSVATKKKGKLPILCNCIMDEFYNTTQMKDFCQMLSVVRGYNIRICIALQSYAQLKKLYEKDTESIVANCGIITYLGTQGDTETGKWLVEQIGKTTIRKEGHSSNFGNTGGGSDSQSAEGRNLFDINELSRFCFGLKLNGDIRSETEAYGGCCVNIVNTLVLADLKYPTAKHFNFDRLGSTYSEKAMLRLAIIEDDFSSRGNKVVGESAEDANSEASQADGETPPQVAKGQKKLEASFFNVASIAEEGEFKEISDADVQRQEAEQNEKEYLSKLAEENAKQEDGASEEALLAGDTIDTIMAAAENSRQLAEKELLEKRKAEEKAESENSREVSAALKHQLVNEERCRREKQNRDREEAEKAEIIENEWELDSLLLQDEEAESKQAYSQLLLKIF